METELLDKLNSLKEPKTDVIQKALELYLQKQGECNTPINRSVDAERNTKRNTDVNTGYKLDQGKASVQIVENYELLRHYKEEIDWLRDRVEHFEQNQDHILAKFRAHVHDLPADGKAKKETPISLYRM